MYFLYNFLSLLAMGIGLPVLIPAILASEKRRSTILQRLVLNTEGMACCPKKPVWFHALSVGEVLSSLPLVKRFKERFPHVPLVFSASTKTGFEIASHHLTPYAQTVFFFPYDLVCCVKKMAEMIQPIAVVIVETDIWPNFLSEMRRRNVPVILINARISKRSFSGYRRFSFFTKTVFSKFHQIIAQTPEDAQCFEILGANPDSIVIAGNIKFDQWVTDEGQKTDDHFIPYPSALTLIAGSTHEGEEAILAKALSQVNTTYPAINLIVVPRDPKRSESVKRLFLAAGFDAILWSEQKMSQANEKSTSSRILIIDAIGRLRQLYAAADIALVGGSLVDFRGHNPLEPAAYSKPVIFGPYMSDFAQIADMLIHAGGAIQVYDAATLAQAIERFAKHPQEASETGKRAHQVFCANRGAVETTLRAIECTLNSLEFPIHTGYE